MKFAIVLPDGAADEPTPELGGRTPLEAAHTPNLDAIAAAGRLGLVTTVPEGFSPGSDVATLSLFGYDPRVDYTGRAPLEAAARGIVARPDALIFRCNLVTIADGKMLDFTAGHIAQLDANRIIQTLNDRLAGDRFRFHAGVSYRNLLIADRAGADAPRCTPPHDIPDQPVDRHLPTGTGSDWVRRLMDDARTLLAGHPVNATRTERGEQPATDIWLWGQGRLKPLATLQDRLGVRGAAIAAVDLIRGIARCAGMDLIDVPGATGYLDTDYRAKGRAACAAVDHYDLVAVHVEAPDEAGHQGDAAAKVTAIEQIDRHVVGPLLEKLRASGAWRILVAPDHPTPVARRVHTATPPPFCMAGTGIPQPGGSADVRFTETDAAKAGLHIALGYQLITRFVTEGR